MESAISFEIAKHLLLSFAVVLAAGAISGFLSQKMNLPDVALYLVAGILLGPEVTGLLRVPAGTALNQIILIFGACYILFDGGASVRLKVLKKIWITLAALSTFGVLVMTAVTGLASHYVLGLPLITSMLLGAAVAPTDPATIIPIFRQVRIKERVSQALISESAFNDATGSVITFAILSVAAGSAGFSLSTSLLNLLEQSVVGIIIGLVMGYLALLLIAHEKYDFLAKYAPVITMMAVVGTYLGAEDLQASGFTAVFVFGIMLGNKRTFGFQMKLEEKEKLEEYVARTAMIMRMFIFILLGSQVDFGLMSKFLFGGIIITLLFMLVARPTTVFLCSLPDRRAKWSFNELLFMCWTRETGVIPAALAGLLLGRKVPGAQTIAAVTFIVILMTILIQATTTKWLAGKLGLLEEG
ncbi:MAG: cation:proton antiporter [Thermodesulfovibrionales bacterium]